MMNPGWFFRTCRTNSIQNARIASFSPKGCVSRVGICVPQNEQSALSTFESGPYSKIMVGIGTSIAQVYKANEISAVLRGLSFDSYFACQSSEMTSYH